MQPHTAQELNQSDCGQVRLLIPLINHTKYAPFGYNTNLSTEWKAFELSEQSFVVM